MAELVESKADDEISDLIARVRESTGAEVGVVIPRGSRAFQTPLNARLLRQFAEGRRDRHLIGGIDHQRTRGSRVRRDGLRVIRVRLRGCQGHRQPPRHGPTTTPARTLPL